MVDTNSFVEMKEDCAKEYLALIEQCTKDESLIWQEIISGNLEQYIAELEDMDVVAYLTYDSLKEDVEFYIEDTQSGLFYQYQDEKWLESIGNIYSHMTTWTDNYDDSEIDEGNENFEENVNYNYEILGCA